MIKLASAICEKIWVLMKAFFCRNTLCIARKNDKIRAQIVRKAPQTIYSAFTLYDITQAFSVIAFYPVMITPVFRSVNSEFSGRWQSQNDFANEARLCLCFQSKPPRAAGSTYTPSPECAGRLSRAWRPPRRPYGLPRCKAGSSTAPPRRGTPARKPAF